jgi:hypothetical protein
MLQPLVKLILRVASGLAWAAETVLPKKAPTHSYLWGDPTIAVRSELDHRCGAFRCSDNEITFNLQLVAFTHKDLNGSDQANGIDRVTDQLSPNP